MSVRVSAIDLRALVLVDAAMMRDVALYVMRLQEQRLEKGIGSSGSPMKAYSPGYAEVRREAGRTTDRRTLTWSGRMKGARNVREVTNRRAVIGWPPGEEAIKALGNQRRTPFVKPTPDETRKASAYLRDLIRKKARSEQARLRAAKR